MFWGVLNRIQNTGFISADMQKSAARPKHLQKVLSHITEYLLLSLVLLGISALQHVSLEEFLYFKFNERIFRIV